MDVHRWWLVALLGLALGCSGEEEKLNELSVARARALCKEYIDESKNCPGFAQRCPTEFEGICSPEQLLDMCTESMRWSTCELSKFEKCYTGDLCTVEEPGGGLPCFATCFTLDSMK